MTSSNTAITREDGETVGKVRPVEGDMWVPETVFGGVLGSATEYDAACSVVLSRGMSSLLEPWWMNDGGSWDRVELVEIRTDRVRVRPWSPFNLAIGGDGDAGRWVNPSENPLALTEPSQP
ncbi:MAG: hypothetical protein QOI69_1913 [Pseudonocardiales bacterium]|nr:hypothetical protein [Pseudonocardiales bacterium]